MGADGSITAYGLQKAEQAFGAEKMTKFKEFICDPQTYVQTMKTPTGAEHKVLVAYSGDNIYSSSFFHKLVWGEDLEKYDQEELDAFPEGQEIAEFLFNECRLFNWEVWT